MGRKVLVARVARAHGVRGEVYVLRLGDAPGILEKGRTLRGEKAGRPLELTVEQARPVPKGRWLVTFAGIADREAVQAIQGLELYLDESELPPLPDGRHYWFQLMGLRVETAEGEDLGTIQDIFETGANDIYVIQGPRGEVLLPSTDEVVQSIDVNEGRMVVTPLPGLIPDETP